MANHSVSKPSIMIPPRLLAGVTILFWGAMTDEVVVALIIAVMLEGKNWVKWSWDFGEAAYVKAFHAALGLLGLLLFIVWMGEVDQNSLNEVMKWFPLCLLPVELAQRYGRSDHMNMNTFFYFARQRMKQDIKEKKAIHPEIINTGYPYIFIVIVVACCNNRMDGFIHVAILILMVSVVVGVSVKRGLGWRRMIWSIPLMLIGVTWLQLEAADFYTHYKNKFSKTADLGGAASNWSTKLGELGKVKQSQEIKWRMWGDNVPEYLRLNVFNKCGVGSWTYRFDMDPVGFVGGADGFESIDDAFDSGIGKSLEKKDELNDEVYIFNTKDREQIERSDETHKLVHIRGAGDNDTEQSLVPAVSHFFAISEMHGEDVTPSVHPLGVLQLSKRKAVIDYRLWYDGTNHLDRDPDKMDLQITSAVEGKFDQLKEDVISLSEEIGLSDYSTAEQKVEAIRRFFMTKFQYSLSAKAPKSDSLGINLHHFMTDGRQGHCEYFATTAALLLREQGVPARYCSGFVAREKSGDTWIMRGTHAHAWCSVWMNNTWEIVDLTPPDWLSMETASQKKDWGRSLRDWFENIKEDFLLWRTDEANKAIMNKVMWVLGAMLLAWVTYRLYKSRQFNVEDNGSADSVDAYKIPHDLILVEEKLGELIGKRSEVQTYSRWILEAEDKVDNRLFTRLLKLMSLHEESRFGGMDRTQKITQLGSEINTLLKE